MKALQSKMGIIIPTAVAILVFVFLAVLFLNNSSTKTVVVPVATIQAGQVIQEGDLMEISVSSNVQGVSNKRDLVGLTAPRILAPGQILYMSNFQSNIFNADIPSNFVVTTINIPMSQAVGGAISVGDYVDISGVADCNKVTSFGGKVNEDTQSARNDETRCVYYILSNVQVLQVSEIAGTENTNGTLGNNISSDTSNISLAVALSYEDTKKVRQAEGVLELWANLSPEQNKTNPPLLDEMGGQSSTDLHDSTDFGLDAEGKVIKRSQYSKVGEPKKADQQSTHTPAPSAEPIEEEIPVP